MKKTLKQSKIVVYSNIQKIVDVLEDYLWEDERSHEEVAEEILKVLHIGKGKKNIFKPFQDNVSVTLENGKITVKTK